jgi:uncharacterized membrane protein
MSCRYLMGPAAFLAVALSAGAHAQMSFRVTPLAHPDTSELQLAALNDKGEIVGCTGFMETRRAVYWRDGHYSDLGALIDPDRITCALDINENSHIVGVRENGELESSGFLYRDGVRTDVNVPGFTHSLLTRVNDHDEAIGATLGVGPENQAFAWRSGTVTVLENLPDTEFPAAVDINDDTVIVGTSGPSNATSAVIWRDGTIMALESLPGALRSRGRGINNVEQVIGEANYDAYTRAFLWSGGQIKELPPVSPELDNTIASGINDAGVVVGASAHTVTFVATVWSNGEAIDLNTLISPRDPLQPYLHFEIAVRVNNRGQILARAADSRVPGGGRNSYLLTPEVAETQVTIDIKPVSSENRINPRSKGKIRVAILTRHGFDATEVDPATVRFGRAGTDAAPTHFALQDIDSDGNTDLVLRFKTQQTGIACGDTSASLSGRTFGGQVITGSDSIRTVGCSQR